MPVYQQVSSSAATSNGILYETASTSGTPKQGCQNPGTWDICSLAQPHLGHTSHLKSYTHTRVCARTRTHTQSMKHWLFLKELPSDAFFSFLKKFFLTWTVFKVSIEFFTILLLFYVLTFWPQGTRNLFLNILFIYLAARGLVAACGI